MSDFIVNSFQIPNAFVDELIADLSGNAVKCYLLIARQTTGWQRESDYISVSQFQEKTKIKDKRTIYAVIDELEQAGLIITERELGITNKFYLVRNVPSTSSKKCTQLQEIQPVTKNATRVVAKNVPSTSSKKCTSHKNNINTPLNTIKKTSQKNTALSLLAEFGITGQLADDFAEHRKSKKAAITRTALEGFQREADKAGIPLAEAIEIAICQNWQGFRADWCKNLSGAKGKKRDDFADDGSWAIGRTVNVPRGSMI
ncbi:replication protein [Aggregatibacter segnis]|uniref:Bacteriophage lambda Replication protein O N-terminal domain-containing protein n=1 Tax=Aggregatibacter segnis ATCC 33393 TaxID=888057 RepID=E6KYD5_9PAST|nr:MULTISPECIES: replication protein [Aggregatibacter]EFU67489.1 conserved hypothetical protein [Aggregatibacter segnis ATCC 33393]QQB09158.1 replication protein [Aggregatibacter segnis]SQH65109.1 Uncharacterised protein [Aggregatibacter segnis ATCC 33393]DAS75101.1 MAG TPA: replication protein O [Caudoviricetes sp.]